MAASAPESWRPVVGFEGFYEVSDRGQVRRVAAGQGTSCGVLRQSTSPTGYKSVTLSKNNIQKRVSVHRIVLEAFVGTCPPGMETRHLDDVKANNCVENLRWGTHSENHLDITRNGNRMPRKKRDACRRGHPKVDGYESPTRGYWVCRPCRRIREARARGK